MYYFICNIAAPAGNRIYKGKSVEIGHDPFPLKVGDGIHDVCNLQYKNKTLQYLNRVIMNIT